MLQDFTFVEIPLFQGAEDENIDSENNKKKGKLEKKNEGKKQKKVEEEEGKKDKKRKMLYKSTDKGNQCSFLFFIFLKK